MQKWRFAKKAAATLKDSAQDGEETWKNIRSDIFLHKKRTMGFFALAGMDVERAYPFEPRLSPGFKSQSQMSPSLLKVP